MSYVGGKGTSNQLKRLTRKRNSRIKDYLHKKTTLLVNHLAELNVSKVYIGWKHRDDSTS